LPHMHYSLMISRSMRHFHFDTRTETIFDHRNFSISIFRWASFHATLRTLIVDAF
jgi:hypothetical protein